MQALENQTLALAGMFQAAVLIDELAVSGHCDSTCFDGSFDSLFTFDAATTREVFGEFVGLRKGFTALDAYLGGQGQASSKNIAYYMLSMMKIAKLLLHNPALSTQIFEGLSNIKNRSGEFNMSRDSMVNKIDGLYQDCISHLNPRILVRGEQNHLLNADNAAKIRTLLLAGIRSAVLWKQLGGSKWKLFWSRKQYLACAQRFTSQV